jgi:hypothetical protein
VKNMKAKDLGACIGTLVSRVLLFLSEDGKNTVCEINWRKKKASSWMPCSCRRLLEPVLTSADCLIKRAQLYLILELLQIPKHA